MLRANLPCLSLACFVLCLSADAMGFPIVQNPSFEASDLSATGVFPGYLKNNPNAMPGWTASHPEAVGVNPVSLAGSGWSSQPFTSVRIPADGHNIAFIQVLKSQGSLTNTLSQSISGFDVGQTYRVTYYEHRRVDFSYSDFLDLTVRLGGVDIVPTHTILIPHTQETLSYMVSNPFTARSETNLLEFIASNPIGDASALIDMVSIVAVPEPAASCAMVIAAAALLRRPSRARFAHDATGD